MRVVAGSAGGLPLVAPAGRTVRPTSDRVREAWFSSLAPRLVGARVLDLFAGSGALGIEAASRGAGHVTAVERDRRAVEALQRNLTTTGLDVHVVVGSLPAALDACPGPFDVVLADPPYDLAPDVLAAVLGRVVPLLAPAAEVWLEASRRAPAPRWPDPLGHVRTRRYGATVLHTAVVGGGTPDDDGGPA